MDIQELNILLDKLQKGTISEDEKVRLDEWENLFESLTGLTGQMNMAEKDELKQRMWSRIETRTMETPVVEMQRNKRFSILRWVAAAVFLFVMAGGAYLYFKPTTNPGVAGGTTTTSQDIAAGSDKAVLTMANGQKIILDSTSGTISKDGDVTVINLNGKLSYEAGDGKLEVSYNRISTPKGGQYQLVLADGSNVWLNAASSLKYPTAFIGKIREVELTGEGYFEIAKDASKPFHVKTMGQDVEVLGTHFNINAYDNEAYLKTTLLEGSIKVSAAGKQMTLKPGQQAQLSSGNASMLNMVADADTEEAVAWKNGTIAFHNADVATIMRELERWYNVEVVVNGTLPKKAFYFEVARSSKLSAIVRVFENNKLKCRIDGDGRKLIVEGN